MNGTDPAPHADDVPVHAVAVELPAPDVETGDGELRRWQCRQAGQLPEWLVEADQDGRVVVDVGWPWLGDMPRDRARALGLALVAATQ